MTDLSTLLREATAAAPPDHLDLTTVVGAGRSRVRRRRVVTGVALAATVGLVTGIGFAGPGDTDDVPPAAGPVWVLALDDATPAEAGRDYDVVGTFTAHSTDAGMDGSFVRGVLPDGRVVLQHYPDGTTGQGGIELVGPDRRTSTDSPAGLGNYLGSAGRSLVFGGDQGSGLWLLDTRTLRWRQALEGGDLDVNGRVQPLSASTPRRIHLAGGAGAEAEALPIYEVDLDGSTAREVVRGGAVAAYGGTLAWTDAYDAPVARVTVGDPLGATGSFDPHTGDCVGKGIGLTATLVVLMTNCADDAGDDEYTDVVDRIDVFDLEGRPLARITGEEFGPVRMTDEYLTISSWRGKQAGTYTYDLDDGTFLRMTDAMSGLAGDETGSGSILVWEERVDGDSGARYVVARMR